MTKIKPFGKKILVTEKPNENVTDSGIVLSGKSTETTAAIILEIGPDVTEVKVDDIVYLEWGKGHPVKVDGQMMAIIDEQYIAAVVEA